MTVNVGDRVIIKGYDESFMGAVYKFDGKTGIVSDDAFEPEFFFVTLDNLSELPEFLQPVFKNLAVYAEEVEVLV